MPVISMFHGITVSMYYLDTKNHNLPYIHVTYAKHSAVYSIPEETILEGSLPLNKEKLVIAWIEIRKEELMADLQLAVTANKVFTIDPLK